MNHSSPGARLRALEARHLPEHERTGYIDRGSKDEGEVCGDDHGDSHAHAEEQPLRWTR